MSFIYDNFRAPQYVDFAGINSSDMTDTSSFFDRETDMDLTPSVHERTYRGSSVSSSSETVSDDSSSVSSSNDTMSDNDRTLTPSRFNTYNAGNLEANRDRADCKVSLTPYGTKCFQVTSSPLSKKPCKLNISNLKGVTDTFNKASPIEFDIPSLRVSTPMVHHVNTEVTTKKTSYGSPPRKSFRLQESNPSASKVCSPSGNTPKPISADSSGIETSVSRKSRCSATPSINRRSRSASNTKCIVSDEEILNDAIRTLSIGSSLKKTQADIVCEVDPLSSPRQLVPVIVPTPKEISKKMLQPKIKGGGPKRKFSPPPKNSRDYSQQPAKYISMAEQVARIQKQTPKRFRTLPSAAALKRGVQSKAARNLSIQPKSGSASSSGSTANHSVAQKKVKEQEGLGDQKGVRVARWPQPKVEPFVLTQYKKTELPKTVFNFDQRGTVLLRDRKTPVKKVPQTTTVQPFSFDKRDQEFLQRKISRMMGVETNSHCCRPQTRRRSKSQGDDYSKNSVKPDPLVHHARIPTVLHKPPFVPVKTIHKVTRPLDLCLFTEKRAKEREEFDKLMNQKEEDRQLMLNKQQEKKRVQEENEILKLRKELVHKARPAPQFRPFKVHPSVAPLTEPHSPNFLHRSEPLCGTSSDEHMES